MRVLLGLCAVVVIAASCGGSSESGTPTAGGSAGSSGADAGGQAGTGGSTPNPCADSGIHACIKECGSSEISYGNCQGGATVCPAGWVQPSSCPCSGSNLPGCCQPGSVQSTPKVCVGNTWTCPSGTSEENCLGAEAGVEASDKDGSETESGSDAQVEHCGAETGYICPSNQYCDFPDNICGAADGPGVCVPRPGGCDGNYDPVCACDGKVYSNACGAAAAGLDINEMGGCPAPQKDYFACGSEFCKHGVEYCSQQYPTSACTTLPAACTGNITCACIAKEPCGASCTQSTEGDLFLICN